MRKHELKHIAVRRDAYDKVKSEAFHRNLKMREVVEELIASIPENRKAVKTA